MKVGSLSLTKSHAVELAVILLLAGLIGLHFYLISKTFVIDPTANIRTAIAGYGDIPLHLTQITKFAYGPFDLDEPIYHGEKLHYPFTLNLISGLLLRFTGAFTFSVLFPVLVLAAANVILAFFLFRRILTNRILAAVAVIVFFLGSGFGAYSYIQTAWQQDQSWAEFSQALTDRNISTISRWDAQYPQQNIDFGAPLSLVFLHQRPFFLGLFGLALFTLLLFRALERPRRKNIIWAGVIYGLLPLWHTHAFVAVSLVLTGAFLLGLSKPLRHHLKNILIIAGIGFLLALPQMLYLVGTKEVFQQESSFITFRLGWMVEPTIGSVKYSLDQIGGMFSLPYLKFILINLGIIFPVFLLITLFAFLPKHSVTGLKPFQSFPIRFFALAGLILFLAVQLIRFQPWDYDNNKLLVYYQFFAAPLAVLLFAKIYDYRRWLGIVSLVIFLFFSLISGVVDNIPRYRVKPENLPVIFDVSARELARFIRQQIKSDEQILTGVSHLNPVSSLAGRTIIVGYPGWLWTRGLDYGTREDEIRRFYSNPDRTSLLLTKYNVKYILLDAQTNYDYKSSPLLFQQKFRKVFEAGQYTLFQI